MAAVHVTPLQPQTICLSLVMSKDSCLRTYPSEEEAETNGFVPAGPSPPSTLMTAQTVLLSRNSTSAEIVSNLSEITYDHNQQEVCSPHSFGPSPYLAPVVGSTSSELPTVAV